MDAACLGVQPASTNHPPAPLYVLSVASFNQELVPTRKQEAAADEFLSSIDR